MSGPLRILLEDRDGRQEALPFPGGEVSIGRAAGSSLVLRERNVSRRHARFLRQNGAVFVEDLGSSNGTRVNGERIEGRRRIRPGDLVQIGDWDLALEGPPAELAEDLPEAEAPPPAAAAQAGAKAASSAPSPRRTAAWRPAALLVAVALASTAVGFAAGRTLRAPQPAAARAAR